MSKEIQAQGSLDLKSESSSVNLYGQLLMKDPLVLEFDNASLEQLYDPSSDLHTHIRCTDTGISGNFGKLIIRDDQASGFDGLKLTIVNETNPNFYVWIRANATPSQRLTVTVPPNRAVEVVVSGGEWYPLNSTTTA